MPEKNGIFFRFPPPQSHKPRGNTAYDWNTQGEMLKMYWPLFTLQWKWIGIWAAKLQNNSKVP